MLNPTRLSESKSRYYQPLARRDKWIILGAITLISLLAWSYMFYMAWAMENMHLVEMWMPPMGGTRAWQSYDFLMLYIMWAGMMIAMMTPTIVPMVFMFRTINKGKKNKGLSYSSTFIFLSGYLISWLLFSLVASAIQYPLHEAGLLNPMMNSRSYMLSGGILVVAGIYQWTPLKEACLNQCRSPLTFLMTSWRDGNLGALYLGIHHGFYCIGCCWALMVVLFAVGVMNMLWVLAITLFVLLEKIGPMASKLSRTVSGIILVVWGGYWLSLYPWSRLI